MKKSRRKYKQEYHDLIAKYDKAIRYKSALRLISDIIRLGKVKNIVIAQGQYSKSCCSFYVDLNSDKPETYYESDEYFDRCHCYEVDFILNFMQHALTLTSSHKDIF